MADGRFAVNWVERVVRLGLTVVFAWAGLAKVGDPAALQMEIANFQLIPAALGALVAAYLPWLELMAAVGLWVPRLKQGAVSVLLLLSMVFLIALLSAKVRGLDITCGCFGSGGGGGATVTAAIVRDVVIIAALTLVGVVDRRRRRSGVRSLFDRVEA